MVKLLVGLSRRMSIATFAGSLAPACAVLLSSHRSLWLARAVLTALTASATVPARAQTVWDGSTSVSWFDGTNWSTNAVPTAASNVVVNTRSPNSTNISGGTATSATASIGSVAATSALVSVTGLGSEWNNAGTLFVGNGGNGALNIVSTLNNGGGAILGNQTGSFGTVTVSGGTWANNAQPIVIGVAGTGTLNILFGGTVSSLAGTISAGIGGADQVLMRAGSWTLTNGLTVGGLGEGTLTVEDGSTVTSGGGIIGDQGFSIGTATVDGAGSTWDSGGLTIGNLSSSNGKLNIQNGGTVSSTAAIIGNTDGSTGAATVTGAASRWTLTSDLFVGLDGTGKLSVEDGGTVTTTHLAVGVFSGSTGTVTVTGANSALTVTAGGAISLGGDGAATLTIRDGGTANSGSAAIGTTAAAGATATVTGAGSTWTNTGNITIAGAAGEIGSLNILNGGVVSGAFAFVGADTDTVGSVTVSGPGSRWSIANLLDIGYVGNGTLKILNGGTVTSGSAVVADFIGAPGQVTVDGAGSTWANTGSLTVGSFDNGTLNILNGGTVSASDVTLAFAPGSIGTLNIGADAGAAATAPGTLNTPTVTFGDGSGQIVFNHTGANYTFAPLISGLGTVRIDSGTTNLSAANTYTGNTTVNGGTLRVNGSIASSPLTTVNAGGTLGGNGIVGNTTINGGTLSPGNSIGLLTVQGSLAFTAAASYLVEVSPSSADRVNVIGAATLGGATVNAVILNANVAKQYLILNATGGVLGTFNPVVSTNLPNFSGSLSYVGNDVYLNFALNFTSATGLNVNQQNVGNALANSFNTAGSIPLQFTSLTPAGLTQASGETATGTQQTTFAAMNLFLGLLTDPFIDGRSDAAAAGSGASSFANEGDATNAYASTGRRRSGAERDAYAAVHYKALPAPVHEPHWSVWSAGFGGAQTTDGNTALGSNDTTSRIAAGAVGFDYRFSPATIAGFALAGGGTSFSVFNGGTGRSDLFQAGAFVRHTAGAAYIAAAAAYGWQDITTDRFVTVAGLDHLRAQFNANAYSGRAEGGYRFVTPWMGLTPYAAGQFTTFDLPAYAESAVSGANTFALAYSAKSVTASRSELGLRSDKSYVTQDTILTLRGRLAWAHDFNADRNIAATFQTLPAASFVVNGAAQPHDVALATASAEWKWRSGWSAATTFEGEFSQVTRSYAGKGVLRYTW
ncbi:T5SS/PEP-CTERM-associated repeat protein [Bradyrhizobium sp. USDA 377]